MEWLLLAGAILAEVTATLSLRAVSGGGSRWWYLPIAVGYVTAFALLYLGLRLGLPLGVAYGIWAACGVALAAIGSRVLFKEPLSPRMVGGMVLIAGGVLLIEAGGTH